MKKQAIRLLGLGLFISMLSVGLVSCKDDDKPGTDDTTKTDDDNTNPDPLAGKDYFKFEGVRVEFRNPAMGTRKMISFFTAFSWEGNKPTGALGDTVLRVMHPTALAEGTYTLKEEAFEEGEAFVEILWGTADGRPQVQLNGGTYELKKVDGKFVSILKNGKGTWTKSNGDKVNYTGIELKATWPN